MVHENIQNIQTHLQFGTVIFPKSFRLCLIQEKFYSIHVATSFVNNFSVTCVNSKVLL